MKNTLTGIIKIILGILLITYGEKYFFSILPLIGINISALSFLVKDLLSVFFYFLVFIIILYIYRDVFSDFRRFKRNIFPNILMSIVFFAVITLIIAITNYLGENLADSFKVNYIGLTNYNIFNNSIDIYFVFDFIKNIIIVPIVKIIIYVLGISSLFYSKKRGVIFSGLGAALITGINMPGSLIYIFINIIPYFVLYLSLGYIYRKNNTNIWYSITTFILYSLFGSILLAKILGG